MRTVRTAVILLGIFVSAAGIAGPDALAALPTFSKAFFAIGGAGLGVTIFVGTGTYTVSEPSFGIDTTHRLEVLGESYTEREWLELLLEEYGNWFEEMEDTNNENTTLVFWTQALLMASLASFFIATTLLTLGY